MDFDTESNSKNHFAEAVVDMLSFPADLHALCHSFACSICMDAVCPRMMHRNLQNVWLTEWKSQDGLGFPQLIADNSMWLFWITT